MPLRILLITNKCPPDFDGGYELRAFQIAAALRDRGHDVDIVTSNFRVGITLYGLYRQSTLVTHFFGGVEEPDPMMPGSTRVRGATGSS